MFDTLHSVRSALETTASNLVIARLDGPDALRLVGELGAIRRLTDGLIANAAARCDATYAHRPSGAKDAATAVGRAVGVTRAEAQRSIDLVAALRKRPLTDTAVRHGPLSIRQAEMIVAVATTNPAAEGELIDTAIQGMAALQNACLNARNAVENEPARRKRQHHERTLRMWTGRYDGMLHGSFALAPETGALIKAVIDGVTQTLFRRSGALETPTSREQHSADGFEQLNLEHAHTENATAKSNPQSDSEFAAELDAKATGKSTGKSTNTSTGEPTRKSQARVKYTVHIVIDHKTLQRGETLPGERCEIPGVGPVNAQWVREILGDAFVTAIIGKGKDIRTITHLGRHINTELRTALIASGRECDIEGCHSNQYLEIDHCEIDHAKQGPTAWWNLGWLCYQHHRLKSQGWTISPRAPNGKRTLTSPAHLAA